MERWTMFCDWWNNPLQWAILIALWVTHSIYYGIKMYRALCQRNENIKETRKRYMRNSDEFKYPPPWPESKRILFLKAFYAKAVEEPLVIIGLGLTIVLTWCLWSYSVFWTITIWTVAEIIVLCLILASLTKHDFFAKESRAKRVGVTIMLFAFAPGLLIMGTAAAILRLGAEIVMDEIPYWIVWIKIRSREWFRNQKARIRYYRIRLSR